MSNSLLHPPRPLWSADDLPPTLPPRDDPPPREPEPPRRRRPLALLLVLAGVIGGATSVGALAATGNLGGNSTTTTVVKTTPTTTSAGDGTTTGLDSQSLYTSVNAGVVDITSKGITTSSSSNSPFGQQGGQSTSSATGTGFEVDSQGHVVTAAHVVEGASSITVKLADGTTRTATVLGKDEATDVAVLKIDATGLTLHPLKLGSSSATTVGSAVAAVGDPFGYDRSISTGIISGVDRTIQAPNGFTVAHALQTDAAINPGNSGGPIVDASGAVIGIADQIATGGGADQNAGVGFAVPIDIVKSELSSLETGKTVQHAYMGVATSADSTSGVAVAQVTAGGPAASAGLKAGDVITKFDGQAVSDQNGLVAAIAAHKPGEKVTVTLKRGSTVTVTLGTQPAQSSTTTTP